MNAKPFLTQRRLVNPVGPEEAGHWIVKARERGRPLAPAHASPSQPCPHCSPDILALLWLLVDFCAERSPGPQDVLAHTVPHLAAAGNSKHSGLA